MAEINKEHVNSQSICCICYKICRHKQILPCCHSATCKSCLKEWIEKHDECPHCGARFRKPKKDLCKIHSKPLDYYCETCNQYLCSDCLLDQIQSNSTQHAKHKIIEAEKVSNANKIKKNAKQEEFISLENLENHLKSLKSYSESLDTQLKSLQDKKKYIFNTKFNIHYQTGISFQALVNEIKALYFEKQQEYTKISDSLELQMISLQSILEESELILTSNDPKIVPSVQSNIEKIKQNCKNFIPITPKQPSIEFTNKLCPQSQSFVFTISDFKKILSNIQNSTAEYDFISSDEQILFNLPWRAKIFPNGTQSGKGTHLSVYIEYLHKDKSAKSFIYQVEIMARKKNYPNITRKYTSIFEPMDSWGWNKIVTTNNLLAGYLDEKGALSLIITLCPTSYTFFIQQNKDELDKISKKCKKLKNDIEKFNKSENKDFDFNDVGDSANNVSSNFLKS